MSDPRAEYERRIARWDGVIAAGERHHLAVSNLRLVTAAIGAVLAWLAFVRAAISPLWAVGAALVFFSLVIVHILILNRNERSARARQLYRRGLDRMSARWMGSGPEGAAFLEGHLYARDLDLFGRGSLFQLLNTARTETGEHTLAAWLSASAAPEEVRARQAAVAELTPRVDFREDIAVLAAEAQVGRTSALGDWAASPPSGISPRAAYAFALSSAISAGLVALAVGGVIGSGPVVGWLIVQTLLALGWRQKVAHVLHRIGTPTHDLGLAKDLLARMEREPFASPKLVALHRSLVADGAPPSVLIKRLLRYVSAFDSTHNLFFQMTTLPLLLLVRSQAAAAIDRWHAAHGRALAGWLRAVGELEALASLATYAYERPTDPFPELAEDGAAFDAVELAHPLLPSDQAVPNDVRLGGDAPHVLIVSGSNMSGKSTLLRAVGLNVVLAQAGAPVRAARLRLSPLAIGSTLRVEDSLQEGHSRFYAEILRIRGIVDIANGPLPLLFLLDEILHGTNSHDRRIGAEGIVTALVKTGAIGLITTHDLALTNLVSTLGSLAANVHFEDRIEQGRMVFDYRMREGVVEHSNALELMRAVGLDV